mmetsp:Transcript_110181/g.154559  ORF Transcript_110181/g.154559 Transcript_110181/m.154559 type:complete len:100 (+) Transcript_110181:38-337(+)
MFRVGSRLLGGAVRAPRAQGKMGGGTISFPENSFWKRTYKLVYGSTRFTFFLILPWACLWEYVYKYPAQRAHDRYWKDFKLDWAALGQPQGFNNPTGYA